MKIGMLWNGKNVHEAKEYFIKKYGRIPDTVEISPIFINKFEIKNGNIEGLRTQVCKEIQVGNILIGIENDENNSGYIKIKEN
jgi:hypothetical protein